MAQTRDGVQAARAAIRSGQPRLLTMGCYPSGPEMRNEETGLPVASTNRVTDDPANYVDDWNRETMRALRAGELDGHLPEPRQAGVSTPSQRRRAFRAAYPVLTVIVAAGAAYWLIFCVLDDLLNLHGEISMFDPTSFDDSTPTIKPFVRELQRRCDSRLRFMLRQADGGLCLPQSHQDGRRVGREILTIRQSNGFP